MISGVFVGEDELEEKFLPELRSRSSSLGQSDSLFVVTAATVSRKTTGADRRNTQQGPTRYALMFWQSLALESALGFVIF